MILWGADPGDRRLHRSPAAKGAGPRLPAALSPAPAMVVTWVPWSEPWAGRRPTRTGSSSSTSGSSAIGSPAGVSGSPCGPSSSTSNTSSTRARISSPPASRPRPAGPVGDGRSSSSEGATPGGGRPTRRTAWHRSSRPRPSSSHSSGALDCDLQMSPLTNSMPVLRDGLLAGGSAHDYVMAWVALPSLTVTASRQRYVPLGSLPDGGRTIRYESLDSDFSAEVTFDFGRARDRLSAARPARRLSRAPGQGPCPPGSADAATGITGHTAPGGVRSPGPTAPVP